MPDDLKPWQKDWSGGNGLPPPRMAGTAPTGQKPWQKNWGGSGAMLPSQQFVAEHTPTLNLDSAYPPGFDYKTGSNLFDLRDFLAADNDAEKQKFIDAGVKAGKWQGGGKLNGPHGDEWYVTQNGKQRAIVGTNNAAIYPLAGAAAHPFQSALMMGTMLLPEAKEADILAQGAQASFKYALKRLGTGTAYNVSRAAFLAAASAAGAGLDDATKFFRGLWDKSSDEEKGALATAAWTGFATELFPRMFGSVFDTIKNGYAPTMSPAQREMARKALNLKLTPLIQQATGGHSALLPLEQSMAEYLFGLPAEKRNMAAMTDLVRSNLIKGGVPKQHVEASMQRIMDSVRSRVDTSTASDSLRSEAAQRMGLKQETLNASHQSLAAGLDHQLAAIEAGFNSPHPELQQVAQQALVNARRLFGARGRQLYGKAEELAAQSAEPVIIDARPIKEAAKDAASELPRDENGQVISPRDRQISGVLARVQAMPDAVGLKQAHDIRSELFGVGQYRNLTPTKQQGGMQRLARVVDEAMAQPGSAGQNTVVKNALDRADAYWKDGIGKFKGSAIRLLAKDPEQLRLVDPGEIADTVFRPGGAPEAERIKGLVGPKVWAQIGDAYWGKLKQAATDALTGKLDPAKFLAAVNKAGDNLATAFGDTKAKIMREFAKRNAAFNGKIPAEDLTADNFFFKLRDYQDAAAQHEKLLQSDYVKMLMDPQNRWDAVDFMMKNPQQIAKAKQFWGENSAEWQQIKTAALTRLISNSVGPDKSLMNLVFQPGALSGVLRGYTKDELTELLGAEHANELLDLSQVIDYVTKKPSFRQTGAFAMASIGLHPFGHLHTLADMFLTGQLLGNAGFVRWLSTGMKAPTAEFFNELGKLIKGSLYLTTLAMVGNK